MQGYVELTVVRQRHDDERGWVEYIALPVGSFTVKYTRTYEEPRQYKTLIELENEEEFYCRETYGEVLSLIKKASSRGTVENVYKEKQRREEELERETERKRQEYEHGCKYENAEDGEIWCGLKVRIGKKPNCKDFDNGNCFYLNSKDNSGNSNDKVANSDDSGTFQNGNNQSGKAGEGAE